MVPISQEAYIFFFTIYGGILIGFIYDLYKIFRRIFHPKRIATLVQDLIFWIIITTVAFYLLILSNQGELRFYNFIGFIIGSLIYNLALSKVASKSILIMVKHSQNFLGDLYQVAIYPFRLGLCLIKPACSYCKKKTKPIYYKIRRYLRLPKRIVKRTKKIFKNYFKKK